MELEGIMSHITTSSRWVHTNARISTLFFLLSGRIASSTRVLHSSLSLTAMTASIEVHGKT